MMQPQQLEISFAPAVDPATCPGCGSTERNLDALYSDSGVFVDWFPCCEVRRGQVAAIGWDAAFGCNLVDDLWLELALDVRHVDLSDSLAVFALELVEPGAGVPQNPLGARPRP